MQKTFLKPILSFLLALIIGTEIAKTKTSFLNVVDSYLHNGFFLTVIALNLTSVTYYPIYIILVLFSLLMGLFKLS